MDRERPKLFSKEVFLIIRSITIGYIYLFSLISSLIAFTAFRTTLKESINLIHFYANWYFRIQQILCSFACFALIHLTFLSRSLSHFFLATISFYINTVCRLYSLCYAYANLASSVLKLGNERCRFIYFGLQIITILSTIS